MILDVYPVAADRQLGVTVATAPSGPEPGIEELFRDYLAEQGTRGAAADQVMATFSKLLEAIDTEQEPGLPRRSGHFRYPARGMSPAAGQAGHQAPAMVALSQKPGVRTATCRTCDNTFTTPVRRGRPPSQCPSSGVPAPTCHGGAQMRPLTLRMSGLRSYRSEVTIDFGDPGLIAIVGDTGAGKSSILEALFFVLYGGCTWDHRATRRSSPTARA